MINQSIRSDDTPATCPSSAEHNERERYMIYWPVCNKRDLLRDIDRRPVDPPPIVQISLRNATTKEIQWVTIIVGGRPLYWLLSLETFYRTRTILCLPPWRILQSRTIHKSCLITRRCRGKQCPQCTNSRMWTIMVSGLSFISPIGFAYNCYI